MSDAERLVPGRAASPDGRDRIVLTDGEREHGEPCRRVSATRRCRRRTPAAFVHIEVHDGLVDLVVRSLSAAQPPKRGRGRPPKTPRTVLAAAAAPPATISPWPGVWHAVGWLPDGAWVAAVGESETRPQDLWLLPVPGVAPDGARPRQVTDSRPAVLAAALAPGRVATGERVA